MNDISHTLKMPQRVFTLKDQFFKHIPAVCLEGAVAKTNVFKETEGEALVVRRAKSFLRHCETKTITIQPEELIIGNAGRAARTISVCPELSNNWIYEELDTMSSRAQDPYAITEKQKKLFRDEIHPYWKGKTLREYWKAQLPEETAKIVAAGGILDNDIKMECTPGDIVPEFRDYLFPKGVSGIRKEAEENLAKIDLDSIEDFEKQDFWKAVVISCDGFEILFKRHADAARELAAVTDDAARKAELLQIAENCDWIASEPPATYHQALQMVYFIFVALYMEGNAGGYSPGRLDQFLLPFYRKDKEAGILDDEKALELLGCLWVKFGEQIWYWNEPAATHYAGFCAFQNVCIGGITPDGVDAVNELTYLMLQATIDVQMVQPSLSVRLSRKNPEDYFRKIAELVQTGSGFPAIHNDEVGIQMLMKKGIPAHEARDWVSVGCVEANLPGKMSQWSSAGHYNMGSAIEFALTNGVHLKTGKKLGLSTGDPKKFASYDEFKEAVYAQFENLLHHFSTSQNLLERLHLQYLPNPIASIVLLDCVAEGKDLMRGGARYNTGPGMNGNGLGDFIDSMAAVRTLVFEEQQITMPDLVDAIQADFKGFEEIQSLLREQAPKWGNDDNKADSIVFELSDFLIESHGKRRGLLGNAKLPALYPVSSNVPQGMAVSALPSGRNAGKPLADGCSPCQGADRNGPTAVLNSLSKLPHVCMDGGTLLNIKLAPNTVADEAGKEHISMFLKTFLDTNVFHVQFNVIGHDVLRCAQEKPEDYASLLVRVAGYSAYFVELSKEVQEDIISRTMHAL